MANVVGGIKQAIIRGDIQQVDNGINNRAANSPVVVLLTVVCRLARRPLWHFVKSSLLHSCARIGW